MRLFKLIPTEAIVIAGLFVLFFLVSIMLTSGKKAKETTHYLSTQEPGAYGSSRFAEIARKLNFPIETSKVDFFNGIPQDIGLIFILSPEKPFLAREKKILLSWLNEGGILVYGNNVQEILADESTKLIMAATRRFQSDDFSPPTQTIEIKKDEKLVDFTPQGSEKSVIKMSQLKPERLNPIFQNIEGIDAPLFSIQEKMYRVVFKPENAPDYEGDNSDNALEDWKILAFDGGYPGIIEKKVGKGKIIALANSLCLANGYIDAGDNAQLAVNLLQLAPKNSKCLFDEFHHDVKGPGGFKLQDTGWGRSFIAILIIGLLAVYSRAVRFIPARIFPAPERRSQVEYLRSMAQILRRARALKIVGRIILRDAQGKRIRDKSFLEKIDEMESEINKNKPSESKVFSIVRNLSEVKK